ncbi:MAG TPA: Mrp/NBP35 family ATP-binding protein [Anaerolineae bacterium]|nr:Mrp/NBP35 family ATP-binding protein [Anaerolineae bacterium]HID84215.1 iron-sulfur cluster carrier protein ApbC [Anaerolineales bacterium]HIQ09595.1 iron-sulfur cluster carrier protein ApbC [Anaerolineaceae bacterium]
MAVTKEQVLKALSQVLDPELGKDLVSLNMIRDVEVEGDTVRFRLVLTTPACPLRSSMEADARRAVEALPGVKKVEVKMDAEVPQDGRSRGVVRLPIRNAIAVGSGKGGVGKSTIAVNLAVALAQAGARVGLIDADIYGPNVPTMLGVDRLPPMREANKIEPAEAYGVKVISIGFMVKPDQPLIWRGPMLHSAIRQFLNDVNWGELDYLVVDLPPGTGDAPLSLTQTLPLSGAVIVTTPQQVSLDDARRALRMFRQLNVPVLGVVENMSYLELPDGTRVDVFGSGGGEELAREQQVELLGAIPMDPAVREGGDQGKPVVVSHPDSPVAQALRDLTGKVAARLSVQAMQGPGLNVSIEFIG